MKTKLSPSGVAALAALLAFTLFWLLPFADAQNISPDQNPANLTTEQAAGLVLLLAAHLTAPLTQLGKQWLNISGTPVKWLSWLVSALIVAGLGTLLGLFSEGQSGFVYALVTIGLAVFKAQGQHDLLTQTSKRGVEQAEPIKAVDVGAKR